MFCSKCGEELPENVHICAKCSGTLQEKNTALNESGLTEGELNQEVKDSAFEIRNPKKEPRKKKKTGKVLLIIFIILALLVGGFFAYPYAKNAFMKSTLSKKDYFTYVVRNNTEGKETALASIFWSDEKKEANLAYHGNLDISLQGKASDFFGCFDVEKSDLSAIKAFSFDWIEDASLNCEFEIGNGDLNSKTTVDINDKKFTDVEFLIDGENKRKYFGMTEFNSDYLMSEYSTDESEFDKLVEKFSNIFPDKKTAELLLDKYIECASINIGNVKTEKSELSAGSYSEKATRISTAVDGKQLKKITDAIVSELKKDKDVEKLIKDYAKNNDSDYKSVLGELEKSLNEFTDEYNDFGGSLKIEIFVDRKGKIDGYGFNHEKFSYKDSMIRKGLNFGLKKEFMTESLEGALDGDVHLGLRSCEGEFEVSAFDVGIANVKIRNIDVKKYLKGTIDCTADIEVNNAVSVMGKKAVEMFGLPTFYGNLLEIFPDMTMSADVEIGGDSKAMLDMTVESDGKKVADLRLEKKDKISKISYPEDCVNLGEENAVMTWLSESDTDKLLEKLSDAGASYKLIYTIKLALGLFL